MGTSASKKRETKLWFERALATLHDSGPIGRASAEYIIQRRIRLGFSPQKHSGACWFDWRTLRFGIFLNPRYAGRGPGDRYLVSMLAHEAKHLEQGLREALSVRGELVAWQWQCDLLTHSPGTRLGEAWEALRGLDPGSRADLNRARALMKRIGGPGYRIGWLPLWPLPAEVAFRLKNLARRLLRFLRT